MRLLCWFGWHRWETIGYQRTRNVGLMRFIQCRRCGEQSFETGVEDDR